MFRKTLAATVFLAALLAAVPSHAQGSDRRTFNADFEHTWTATLSALEGWKYPISTAERNTGLIRGRSQFTPANSNQWVGAYTTQTVRSLSGWTDVQLGLTLVVARRGDNQTEVKVEAEIASYNVWTEIWRGMASNGNLEKELFDNIQSRLDLMTPSSGASAAGAASATAGNGTVDVSSRPDKADVEVDGNFVGQTPAKLTLAAGQHSIKVTRKGYEAWSRNLQVMAGATTSLAAELGKE